MPGRRPSVGIRMRSCRVAGSSLLASVVAWCATAVEPPGPPPEPNPLRPAPAASPTTDRPRFAAVHPTGHVAPVVPPRRGRGTDAPADPADPLPLPAHLLGPDWTAQSADEALRKSQGCVSCHAGVGDMHASPTVRLGCTDCHGGNADCFTKHGAHVHPREPEHWPGSANPVRSYTLLNHESPEFIRFVNPGDLRVAHQACGGCHAAVVLQVQKSMMTHGCMLWGAALYNNGAVPSKHALFGESYSGEGVGQRLQTVPPPSPDEIDRRAVLRYLDPLPRFERSQPGNILRIFERGGRFRPEVGNPERLEEPGRPRTRLSIRGLGTENRTDPVFVGLTKTRLFDPTLNFLGTNDQPGDYRSSGCTGCHVIYANDRSPVHAGPYAAFGNRGESFSVDPMIPKGESGHPIEHRFVPGNGIPTSQCMVCHIHPGTTVMNSYVGYMWWDEETDADLLYPRRQRYPGSEEKLAVQFRNPNQSAAKNLLADPEFLANLTDLNDRTRQTQFADFHGHGWAFRAVFKHDRKGNLLDHRGEPVADDGNAALRAAVRMPERIKEIYRGADGKTVDEIRRAEAAIAHERDGLPVHLLDIHMEKGMHCVDCHFVQDMHGNTKLYGEVRAAIEISCIDCHGTVDRVATLRTSGPASNTSSPEGGRDLRTLRTPSGKRRFVREGERVYQNSMVEDGLTWEIVQTKATVDPRSDHYNALSAFAKTVRVAEDGAMEWGGAVDPERCAHRNDLMSCIACHSAWNPSCFGCHLVQRANQKAPSLHNEGDVSRNLTSYNFQTLRDDVYMLARDGNATGNRVNPSRSSCAIHVGSYNNLRESIYVQQQTISAEGFSGIAFSTNVPHTVRGGPRRGPSDDLGQLRAGTHETKMCTDCHLATSDDNNAVVAQLLMQGTNATNFIGRYAWVGLGGGGLAGVVVTEQDEPQTVIGSAFHRIAYPDDFRRHVAGCGRLEHAYHHAAADVGERLLAPFKAREILTVQHRGEYLYAACGADGLRVFDIAFIDNKGFSQRITSAPVSPLGQQLYVKTAYATAVAAPATTAPDPTRTHDPANHEGSVHALYGYLYVTDLEEGLILVGAGTLLDGNPLNNFLERALTWNPGGLLRGARSITIAGEQAWIACDAGLVVVSLSVPTCPEVLAVIPAPEVIEPRSVAIQFRHAFVCDAEGLKTFDISDPRAPVRLATVPLPCANAVYVARTYAYVAAGPQGLVIVDVEKPAEPFIDQVFDAGGCIDDARDVKLGITYVSQFAYVADGANGLRVIQLSSPDTPGNVGFSPRPTPELVATYPVTKGGLALSVSEGVDRDRAVDESGNQLSVFGRVGARPFNREEQERMWKRDGKPWKVSDDPFDTDRYRVRHE
ncbi:MAG: hypothetical protein ACKOCW_01625 [Planctomycetaceae bacterium]